MKFAQWVYLIAGIYGILVTLPLYFTEGQFAAQFPPPLTHPEYYYGFLGVTLAWQALFLVIARDPVRSRHIMPVTLLEKAAYGLAVLALFALGRVTAFTLTFGVIDLVLGALFYTAYRRT